MRGGSLSGIDSLVPHAEPPAMGCPAVPAPDAVFKASPERLSHEQGKGSRSAEG